ncbi:MAG: 6,7-dimethyl-8-ribityllumazine synthase [Halodesulfurarchaeum sp.]
MVALALVVAEFNRPVTEEMEAAAREAAVEADATIVETVYVPGAYDAPLAADRLARREDVDAVAVIGAIIAGDTDHDQVIGTAAASRLTDVSLERDTPISLGVTGPGMSADEARARVDKGREAVESAIQLVEGLPSPVPSTEDR